MSGNPNDTRVTTNDKMDVNAADQNDGANVNKAGNNKGKGKEVSTGDQNKEKEGRPNVAKLILSRNKGNKTSKHKKRAEETPGDAAPAEAGTAVATPAQVASKNNVKHFKRTTWSCHMNHELYEDDEGNYVERWDLPDEFTVTDVRERGVCHACKQEFPGPLTMSEYQSEPDVDDKGKEVYSLRDMQEAEETGADCPGPCRPQ